MEKRWHNKDNKPITKHNSVMEHITNITVNDSVNVKETEISAEFQKFLNWINKFGDKIQKLKKPFTEQEALNIIQSIKNGDYSKEVAEDVIMGMQNKKDLLTKYESANLTFLSWIRNRKKNEPQPEPTLKRKTL